MFLLDSKKITWRAKDSPGKFLKRSQTVLRFALLKKKKKRIHQVNLIKLSSSIFSKYGSCSMLISTYLYVSVLVCVFFFLKTGPLLEYISKHVSVF